MQSKKTGKMKGLAHLVVAFYYSMSGMRAALNETAVRHELVLVVLHIIALSFVDMPMLARLILTCIIGLLLTAELLNTSIEAVVDLVSPQWNALAKKAKDLGSAAVFCVMSLYGVAWIMVLWEVL
ncbi:MAG: diacylglycerol kinase [Bacteroidales bacterium]|nr:diacylglycerol kinase [Bacteroidales bacterium]